MRFINISIAFAVVVIIGGVVLSNNFSTENQNKYSQTQKNINQLPVNLIKGSFVVDVDNKKETVGLNDYVFVGKVVENQGTTYKDIVTMEDEYGNPKNVGTPYTNYTVEVIENIKGKLKTNTPFNISKQGGINQDKKAIYLFENDILPEANKYYIFLGYAQKDGSILISGPNSNILLNVLDKKDIVLSKEYKSYEDAYKNQITNVKRERYTSVFEDK